MISRLIDKFRRSYRRTQGGIFTNQTREKILTKKGLSGRGRTINQFWYRQRENVKTALIDLQLFIEASGKENVNQVVTQKTIEPAVEALLRPQMILDKVIDNEEILRPEPDLERARIAQLFIQTGFNYLRSIKVNEITLSHGRTIAEAIDLSNYLVESIKPERERRYFPPTDAYKTLR